MKVIIDLQEGFQNDHVQLFVDGKLLYQKESLSTKTQVGLADHIESDLSDSEVALLIRLPEKNLTETIPLKGQDPIYLGLSVAGGRITHFAKKEPFFYM